jgi:hypothetical protein
VGLLLVLSIYVSAIWGRAGLLLPAPLDNWHYVFYRALIRWSEDARLLLRAGENATLYSGVEAFLLGLVVPVIAFALIWRRPPSTLGLRRMDAAGWWWTWAGIVLSIPAGLWITGLVPPQGSELRYVVRMLSMIPEHFLIFGVGVALLLPDRLLRKPALADAPLEIEGHRTPSASGAAAAKRPDLFGMSLFAIFGSTALFVAVHVGAKPAELVFSAPMGVFYAYVTWRTGSIWPALLAHWTLNLAPLGIRGLFE